MLEHLLSRTARFVYIYRVAAWSLLAAILILHVVPATHRPMTGAGSNLEHVGIFLLLGLAFGLGYSRQVRLVMAGLAGYCLLIEAIQLIVPGRHARLSDLLVDGASALLGVGMSVILTRLWLRPDKR